MTSQLSLVVGPANGRIPMNTVAPYTYGVYRDSRSGDPPDQGPMEIDPDHRNVITGVNFGRGLPRALHCKGVPPVNSLTTSMAHSSSST